LVCAIFDMVEEFQVVMVICQCQESNYITNTEEFYKWKDSSFQKGILVLNFYKTCVPNDVLSEKKYIYSIFYWFAQVSDATH
jgi:hypothetical protein